MKQIYILTFFFIFISIKSLSAQTLDVDFTGTCGASVVLNEQQTIAQSFTAGASGNLNTINVGVSINACTETTVMNCVATIYEGDCNGTALATQSFAFPTDSNNALSMKEISFTSPANIVSGQVYTLEISTLPNQNCNIDPFNPSEFETVSGSWHGENAFNCGGSYSGGTGYDPGCVVFDFDYYIQTYVASPFDVDFTGTCGASVVLNEQQTIAQSFTAGVSGNLNNINVGVSINACTETTVMNCVATIYEGDCNGTALTTQSFAFPTDSNNALSMKEISFTSPANVVSGQVYTLEISTLPNQNCNIDPFNPSEFETVSGSWHGENAFNCGGSYSGGTGYDPGCVVFDFDYYIQTSINSTLNTNNHDQNKLITTLFPNPSSDFVQVSGLEKNESFEIYNILGIKMKSGKVSNNQKIDIQNFLTGVYFLKFDHGNTIRFIKK
jgi:hypothetical protein